MTHVRTTVTFILILFLPITVTTVADATNHKDLVQPNERHLEGVPQFLRQPKQVYYAWTGKPAVFECIAEPVSHAVVLCADKKFPYMGSEHSEEQRLQVIRLDANGNLDADGSRWHMKLSVRTKDLEEWFDAYMCTCEVWNRIPALNQEKKIFSHNSTIVEAYLDSDFQLEPIPENLFKGQRLLLACQPPKGEPKPKVYWLKNGKQVDRVTFPHIIIDDYNRLIIEQVELQDAGNYTCTADTLGMKQRYSTAQVTVQPFRLDANKRLMMTPYTAWGPCIRDQATSVCQQVRTRTCVNVTAGDPAPPIPPINTVSTPIVCPQPIIDRRDCPINDCDSKCNI